MAASNQASQVSTAVNGDLGQVLHTAFDYQAEYMDQYVFIKIGGEVADQPEKMQAIAEQAVVLRRMGAKVAIVHGGGAQGNAALKAAGIQSETKDNIRVTFPEALPVLEEVFFEINREIVNLVRATARQNKGGVTAKGLGGFDGRMVIAEAAGHGFHRTGEPKLVDAGFLRRQFEGRCIPVIYPICQAADDAGHMNVNADSVVAALANSVDAKRVILCSGRAVEDNKENVIKELDPIMAEALIADGTISEGMQKKVEEGLRLIENPHIEGVVILSPDGSDMILKELFTEQGAGTLFRRSAPTP